MDDSDAIRRMKQGDPGGLGPLMERYQVQAARAAFLITHDNGLAEDVVQDTFVRIYEKIRQFDDARPFQPYLMQSVVHAALNAVRGQSRISSLDSKQDEVKALLDRAGSVESEVEFAQLQRDILAALSKLPPRQREVVVQRYYLEMSEKEMGEASGTAPGTIKWLLNTARRKLRELLGQKGASNE